MSRSKIHIDEELLLEKRGQKKSIKEISCEMGISTATLSRRISELENKEGILTKYRELQGLQLTALQFRILQEITPEKIKSATLIDLVRCFSILSKAGSSSLGIGKIRVSGLLQYLVEMERGEYA